MGTDAELRRRLAPLVEAFVTSLVEVMMDIGRPPAAPQTIRTPPDKLADFMLKTGRARATTIMPPIPAATEPRKRPIRYCRKCGAAGFRSDGCGRTHNAAAVRPPDGEDDEEGHGSVPVASRTVAFADPVGRREAPPPSSIVDEHDGELEHDEIDGGGAFPVLASYAQQSPSVELSPTDRREVCELHGWVGRQAFQRDRHDLCADVVDATGRKPCYSCRGKGMGTAGLCKRCDGTGFARMGTPPESEEAESNNHVDISGRPYEYSEMLDGNGVVRRRRRRTPEILRPTIVSRKGHNMDSMLPHMLDGDDEEIPSDVKRPKTRGDCVAGPRPCPWVGCRHSLYLDVTESGSIRLTFPDLEVDELHESCALDVAERGGLTLDEVGILTNLSRERIRQLEKPALAKVRAHSDRLEDPVSQPHGPDWPDPD